MIAAATTATFLDKNGNPVAGLEEESQLTVTPVNTTLLTFTRTGVFAGTLTRLAAGTTALEVALFHIQEQHENFGPHNISVTVQ